MCKQINTGLSLIPLPTHRIADSSKQAIAMLGAHFCNLLLAQLLPLEDTDHCIMLVIIINA